MCSPSPAVRGWRPAGLGASRGLFSLAAIVAALGPLLDRVPLHLLQLAESGSCLLLFGMRWLRRRSGARPVLIPLHDEATAFAAETADLRSQASAAWPARLGCCADQLSRPFCSKDSRSCSS